MATRDVRNGRLRPETAISVLCVCYKRATIELYVAQICRWASELRAPLPDGSCESWQSLHELNMAITDSVAAFKARAAALGLQEPVLQLLVDGGLNTMSRFAFSSAYVPGHPDETAFVAALKTIMSRDPEVAELAILRRLLRESYALSASALKQIAEQTEDGPARKLSQPERAERLQKQQSRITGLQIQGVYEPSDRMIDKLVQMYEE